MSGEAMIMSLIAILLLGILLVLICIAIQLKGTILMAASKFRKLLQGKPVEGISEEVSKPVIELGKRVNESAAKEMLLHASEAGETVRKDLFDESDEDQSNKTTQSE